MPQADIDVLYNTPPPPSVDDGDKAAIDALYGDGAPVSPDVAPNKPGLPLPPTPPAVPPPPGPQDSDGIFTTPLRWVSDAGGILDTSFHALKDAATGQGKTEDYPELTQAPDMPTGAGLRLAAGYMTSSDPQQIAGIALKALPGSSTTDASGQPLTDKFGNPLISYNGATYYLKKPGFLQPGSVARLGTEAVLGGLAATGIGDIPALAGRGLIQTAARSAAQGAGQAALSAGSDVASGALGSDQNVSAGRAGAAGVLGAAAEPVAAVIGAGLGGVWNALRGTARSLFGSWGGSVLTDAGRTAAPDAAVTPDMLTKTGQMIFDKAGVDPAKLSGGQLQTLDAGLGSQGGKAIGYAPDSVGGPAASRVIQAAQSGIPLTTGQITGNPIQLALEDRLRQAASPATGIMRDFGADQQAATAARAGALIPGSQPGVAPLDEAGFGQLLQSQIQARAAALKQATSNAYAKLPYLTQGGMAANGPTASFDPSVSSDLLDQVKDVSQRYLSSVTPAGNEARATLTNLVSQPGPPAGGPWKYGVTYTPPGTLPAPPGDVPVAFNVGAADTALRKLNQLYASASTDGDRAAVAAFRGKLNDAIDQAGLTGAMSGDPGVLAAWQAARAARAAQGEFMAQNSPAANSFMTQITQGNPSGQEVVNGLYGASQLGSKTGTTQVLDHLQSQFPPGSPEWATVQQAAVRRVLFGGTENTAEMTPNNIANRIDEAVNGNGKEVTQRVLDPDTIAGLTDFSATMRTLQQSAKQNPSGTAYTVGSALQSLAGRIPIIGAAFRAETQAVRQAQAAVAPGLPYPLVTRPTDQPLGVIRQLAPAVGGQTGQSDQHPLAGLPTAVVRAPFAAGAALGRLGGGLLHLLP